ncbi:MurR/RpiR family transcriptional regulator [Microbulbifer sp. SA54]|uniref:MurR/RpiR family transcriptional regulator n=1 Tax=Microbulbifer sp. SA54 TaxID=3401577 RepID=UPI003AAAF9A1
MSHEPDIVSKIHAHYGQLRDAEQKIARLILDDINFAAHASISELAGKAGVSEATITRFAKAVDCKNVRDLKLRLAQALAVGQRFYTEVKTEPGANYGVYDEIKAALDHNARLITEAVIEPAVAELVNARQVLVFGVGGGSTVMAQECQHRFFRLGFPATAYCDPMLMRMAASTIDTGDVVLCLSLGGYSPDVQEAAEIARDYGAATVAITVAESPLAKAVHHVIPIEPLETDYIFRPSAARYVMLAAIDVLATELAVKQKRKSREALRRLKHTLDSHKHGEDRLPLGD